MAEYSLLQAARELEALTHVALAAAHRPREPVAAALS